MATQNEVSVTHPAIVLADELIAAREKATPGEWVLNQHQGAGNLFRLDNEMSANEFCRTAPANLPFVRLSANNSAKLAEMLKVATNALELIGKKSHAAHQADRTALYALARIAKMAEEK